MLHIRNILGIKFQLKLTILNFGSNSPKKGISTLKKRANQHRILHIRIILDSEFQLQQTYLIF